MMKDEAPYLLEWFAHHLAVGFTDILVYTNDCTDGTDDMLIRLEELGLGHHRRNIIREGIKPQPSAIKHAQIEPVVQNSDWVLLFDADEFLSIKYGDGSIDQMLTAAGDADGIVITWRTFGSGNVIDWSRDPVTEQYRFAAPALWNKGWGVKTLFKFDPEYWKLGIHRPKMKAKHLKTDYPKSINWLNGSGLPMEDYFKYRGWRSIRRTVGYEWAQMNHYAVKGIDAYAIRKFRGNVNNKKDKYNDDYWSLQDRNEVEETSILRYREKRAAIMAELLTDPTLNTLHFAALERVEARLKDYKKTDAYRVLKAGLIKASRVPITQVSAKPPKARDPSKIAAQMSEIEQKAVSKSKVERLFHARMRVNGPEDFYVAEPIDLSSNVTIETVENKGILLPADPRLFNSDTLSDVARGKFDRKAARHIEGLLYSADRMLEIGAGICFIPILVCTQYSKVVVLAHEERSDIAKLGRNIAANTNISDSARLKIIDGPLFFASDTGVQASGLAALINDFKPTVLRVNDQRISPRILASQNLGIIRRLILTEFYVKSLPDKGKLLAKLLEDVGLSLTGVQKNRGFIVFDRVKSA